MRTRKYRAYHDKWGWALPDDIDIWGDGSVNVTYRNEDGSKICNCTEKTKELHVMDYTGLSDKDEKEIYEGDIIKSNFDDRSGEIKWHGNGFWIVENNLRSLPIKECREIIGNIYKNPELLEK